MLEIGDDASQYQYSLTLFYFDSSLIVNMYLE